MTGSTAPPDDSGLESYHTRQDTQLLQDVANMPAGRFKNSKMFGPTSVGRMILNNAHGLQPMPPRPPIDRSSVPSWFFAVLRNGSMPTLDQFLADLPFAELSSLTIPPPETSVLKIADIPYGTTRQEMVAFVGQHAQISRMPPGSSYYAVHILMERETGKTMDCFIELSNAREAAWVAKTMQNRANAGRPPKVNNRLVQVSVSSQEELMHELFPRAKHVAWTGCHPIVDTTPRQYYPGVRAAGFQGFLHSEEYVQMIKIAEMGDRALFAKTLSRVYETTITILHKYPWHTVEHVSLAERRAIYDLAVHMLQCLMITIENGARGRYKSDSDMQHDTAPPTAALLAELTIAILGCPGFSEKQKAIVVRKLTAAGYSEMTKGNAGVKLGGNSAFSSIWPFAVLAPFPDIEHDVVDFYLTILRNGTLSREELRMAAYCTETNFAAENKSIGNFKVDYGCDVEALSLAEAACLELQQVEQVYRSALRGETLRRLPSMFI